MHQKMHPHPLEWRWEAPTPWSVHGWEAPPPGVSYGWEPPTPWSVHGCDASLNIFLYTLYTPAIWPQIFTSHESCQLMHDVYRFELINIQSCKLIN